MKTYPATAAALSSSAAIPTNRQIYKVALASIVGSVIEQYDFLVTGIIAATIWGDLFFKLPGLAAVAVPRVGKRRLSDLADIWRRADSDSRRIVAECLRDSHSLDLYRPAGDGVRSPRHSCDAPHT